MNFLDIKTDFAFKKVFGSEGSKDLLISFLNSVIDFDQQQTITDLTIVDPYSIPLLKGMKDTFVDVKAELSDNTKVIKDFIYIQKSSIEFATKTGIEQGEWKNTLKIIENAVRIGLPMQAIIELTGLDEEKISSFLPKR